MTRCNLLVYLQETISIKGGLYSFKCCRYNSVGQLLCVICNQQIKSNILWITHLKSRKHKDAVTAFKSQKSGTSSTLQQRPSPATVTSSSPSSSSHTSKASQGKDRLHEEQVTSGASSRKRALPDEVRILVHMYVTTRFVTIASKLMATGTSE